MKPESVAAILTLKFGQLLLGVIYPVPQVSLTIVGSSGASLRVARLRHQPT
jgi:hypothetical protein